MAQRPWWHGEIERIAHTQFSLKFMLRKGMQQFKLTEQGKQLLGNYDNEYDMWVQTFGEKFFDMGTLIRLATAIEQNLKHYYMGKKGHQNRAQLHADPKYKKNIFQRIMPWQNDGALRLYKEELHLDLTLNAHLKSVQEIVFHRHLYAHSAGLLDDEYVDRLKQLTGIDLLQNPQVTAQYPKDDLYWFEPLKRLDLFVEEARRFFRQFPA